MRQLGVSQIVGVEGYKPSVEQAKSLKTHDEIIEADVRELECHFHAKQFDACVALDVIEHLTKSQGLKLMESMERIAVKKVVFFTPCGFLPQRHVSNDDLQEHLSGWAPPEMRQRGYAVAGLLGPKRLRGEYHVIKGQPRIFWAALSLLGHFLWTHRHPEKAAAILCVKDLAKP
ncbi:MAG: methyltransferase domain-containing protein [Verrucomicrobia bacterium]|nr:methyltransferase domain-containing protein [Verrucomicrobiota bacterium]